MTPALDRFARVMVDTWVFPGAYDRSSDFERFDWQNACRAALLDMAENPSEAMVQALFEARRRNPAVSGREIVGHIIRAAAEPQEG